MRAKTRGRGDDPPRPRSHVRLGTRYDVVLLMFGLPMYSDSGIG